MRKLNQIRRAIIFACLSLMFGSGAGFSANVAASEARTQAAPALTRTAAVHNYGLSAGQLVAGATQTVRGPQTGSPAGVVDSLRNGAEAVGLNDNESSQTNGLRYGTKLNPIQQPEPSPRKIEGDWDSTLDAGVAKLKLILHVARKDGLLSATLDSPDQGATGLPIDSITLSSVSVRFEMKALGAIYEGQLATDDSQIDGKWIQGSQTFPLVFKRLGSPSEGTAAAESALKLQKVDAGGHSLNLLIGGQRGGEATPVVILEAGFGAGIASWSTVQREIAKFAQVVSYDRAGLGQSDPGPKPRDAKHIATELHAALQKAGIKPPYVLVGHSLGGPFVRVFAGMYPTEVAGLVLIDPSQEAFHLWLKANRPPELIEQEATIAKAPQGLRDEHTATDAIYEQARAAKIPPGIPVTLLTAMQDASSSAEMRRVWAQKHKEWIAKVSGGKHIIAEKSGHAIQAQEPALVIEAIRQVIEQARGRKPTAP